MGIILLPDIVLRIWKPDVLRSGISTAGIEGTLALFRIFPSPCQILVTIPEDPKKPRI